MTEPPLRIAAIYHTDLRTPQAGGVFQFIRGCLRFAGPSARFAYWGRDEPHADPALAVEGVEIRSYCGPRKPGIVPETARLVWHLWRRRRDIERDADVVFLHESYMTLPWMFTRRRPPIVLVTHNCMEMGHLFHTRGYILLHRFTDRVASRVAARVVCVSRSNLAYYAERFPDRVGKYVYNCTFADDRMMSTLSVADAKRRLGLPEDRRIVCYAGRIHPQKKVDQVVSVFARLHRKRPDTLLCIAGDGPLMPAVREQVAREGLGEAVRFLGVLDRRSVGDLFRASEFSMLFSHWEGTPMALLESLASGTPAIVSDVADHRHIVEEGRNGFLATADRSDDDIAALAERILDDPETFREGARRSGEQYLASRTVPKIVDILHAAAKK